MVLTEFIQKQMSDKDFLNDKHKFPRCTILPFSLLAQELLSKFIRLTKVICFHSLRIFFYSFTFILSYNKYFDDFNSNLIFLMNDKTQKISRKMIFNYNLISITN